MNEELSLSDLESIVGGKNRDNSGERRLANERRIANAALNSLNNFDNKVNSLYSQLSNNANNASNQIGRAHV